MGFSIKWDCTYKCNLNCAHCINGDLLGSSKDDISLEDFGKILEDISCYNNIDYIHMLGGEPTVRKDFVEICKFLDSSNIKFGFNTNSLLINKGIIEKIILLKNFHNIIFSIEAPCREINDSIRGKKVYDKVIDAIEKTVYLKQTLVSNVTISINMVVCRKNYMYIREMIELAY